MRARARESRAGRRRVTYDECLGVHRVNELVEVLTPQVLDIVLCVQWVQAPYVFLDAHLSAVQVDHRTDVLRVVGVVGCRETRDHGGEAVLGSVLAYLKAIALLVAADHAQQVVGFQERVQRAERVGADVGAAHFVRAEHGFGQAPVLAGQVALARRTLKLAEVDDALRWLVLEHDVGVRVRPHKVADDLVVRRFHEAVADDGLDLIQVAAARANTTMAAEDAMAAAGDDGTHGQRVHDVDKLLDAATQANR
jgi:hypothetical protein